jgi:phage shock protein E
MKTSGGTISIVVSIAVAVIIAAVIPVSCFQNIAPKKQVLEWIAKGALIVDVRTPGEFNSGHYKGSINIPVDDVEKNLVKFGDKNRLIVVYCRTGNRSGKAKAILDKNGFKNVINGGGLKEMP